MSDFFVMPQYASLRGKLVLKTVIYIPPWFVSLLVHILTGYEVPVRFSTHPDRLRNSCQVVYLITNKS